MQKPTISVNRSITQVNNQYTPPNYPTGKSRKSNTKIFLAVGGVLALLLLLFAGVAAIVVYNLMSDEKAELKPTPTPVSNRVIEKDSPTPKSSATPKTKPTTETNTTNLQEDDPTVKRQI